jgi:uracil permease
MTQELSASRKTIVGIQFLFVAFGSTVLVPLLVGLDPATALFTAGIGTFLFHLVTKGQVPIYLGSSFAFIAPIISASQQWGMPGTIAGIAGVALVYILMSALIKWQGRKLLDTLFPPVVIGPVIILIGLSLSPAAVNMAKENWLLAFISLISAILVLVFGRGLVKLVPVVIGIVVGYIVALCMGLIDRRSHSSLVCPAPDDSPLPVAPVRLGTFRVYDPCGHRPCHRTYR